MMNRKFEFQADVYACKCGYGRELKQSLIKLFKESTGMIKPDFLYGWARLSHPTIHERIGNIDNYMGGKKSPNTENLKRD